MVWTSWDLGQHIAMDWARFALGRLANTRFDVFSRL